MQAVGLGTLPVMVAGVPDVLRPLLDQVVSQGWPSSISSSRAPARRGWTSCRASKALPLLDVQKFFDTVPWEFVVKAVERVTDARWVLPYVKRWLAAPLQHPDGTLEERDKGTPQGSAVSPVLANLFMPVAFDAWMVRNFLGCPFERYADDAVVHCVSKRQAEAVLAAIAARISEVDLALHPDKTRIVYCKDGKRRGEHEHTSFTFLGFTFRARKARNRGGGYYTGFLGSPG